MMKIKRLVDAQQQWPFQPFKLHVADGRSIDIRHPEVMSVVREDSVVVVFTGTQSTQVVDILMITGLEFPVGADASAGNRRKRRNGDAT